MTSSSPQPIRMSRTRSAPSRREIGPLGWQFVAHQRGRETVVSPDAPDFLDQVYGPRDVQTMGGHGDVEMVLAGLDSGFETSNSSE